MSAVAADSEGAGFSPADAVRAREQNGRDCGFCAPSRLEWGLDEAPPVAQGVWLCVNLDAKESTANVIRGPSADDKPGAARFRQIWGPKAELRRFKDGSIVECAAFPAPLRAQQGLYHRALSHLLRVHLSVPADGVITPGLPLEATLERAQLPFAAATGKGHECTSWATSSAAASQACGRALDRLRVSVADIAERLSLRVASVIGSGAGPRGTLRLPIAPHPLAGAATAERAALEPWLGPASKVAKAAGSQLLGSVADDEDAANGSVDTESAGADAVLKGKKKKSKGKGKGDPMVSKVVAAARSIGGAGTSGSVEKVLLSTPMASAAVEVTDVVLNLEDSSQWPLDPTAIAATKTAFYLQIGRHLEREYGVAGRNKDKGAGQQGGLMARAAKDHLMVLVDGYAFRCRIHLDREIAVLRRIAQPSFTGAVDARALERGASPAGIVDTSQLLDLDSYDSTSTVAVPEPRNQKKRVASGASFSVISSSGKGAVAKTELRDRITTDENGYAITPGGLPTKIKMMSVEDALGRAAFLEMVGYRRPRHAAQVQAFIMRTPGFVGAVRLLQQWLASIGAEQCMPLEAVELLVASVYTEPRPFLPPSTASGAFLRVLRLIATFDWAREALFVDIDSSAALDTKRGLGRARARYITALNRLAAEHGDSPVGRGLARMSKCPVFLVTPEDVCSDGTMRPYWTASSPGPQEWNRVVVAAKLSHGLLLRSWRSCMDPASLWQAASAAEAQSTTLDASLRMHGPKTEAVQEAVEAVVAASGASAQVARKIMGRVERQVKQHLATEPVSAESRAKVLLEASRMYQSALRQADGAASAAVLVAKDGSRASHAGVVATCMSTRARLASQGEEVGSGGYRPVPCLGQSGAAATDDWSVQLAASGAGADAKSGAIGNEGVGTILSDWDSLDAESTSGGSGYRASCAGWQALFKPSDGAASEGEILVEFNGDALPRRDGFCASPPSRIPAPILASRLSANVYRGDNFKLFECFAGTLPPESLRGIVSAAMLPAQEQHGKSAPGAPASAITSKLEVFASAKAASGKGSVRQQLRFGSTADRLVRLLRAAARASDSADDN